MRALVVDDQRMTRYALRILLSGYDDIEVVAEAASGPEAVRVAREQDVDVVLMDIRMPGGGGIEATRELALGAKPLPVVLMTSLPDLDTAVMAEAAGAASLLLKDADSVQFAAALRAAVPAPAGG